MKKGAGSLVGKVAGPLVHAPTQHLSAYSDPRYSHSRGPFPFLLKILGQAALNPFETGQPFRWMARLQIG